MNNNSIDKMNRFLATKLLPALLCLVMLVSCEKDVTNIKLPPSDPKLVVGCFISPQDTLITVTLSRSIPIFGSTNNSNNLGVADASITISNGISSSAIPYNPINGQYELNADLFPIVSGQAYTLTATTPDGESVSGSCTVPVSNLNSLTVEFTDTISDPKIITVKWNDIAGEVNYYRAYAQIISTNATDTSYSSMFGNTTLFKDNQKDGNEFYSKLEGYDYYDGDLKAYTYDIYLLTIDREYYTYYYSLAHYTYDDPFSEPSPLYTNIKGGLGVFAAYQKLYVRVP